MALEDVNDVKVQEAVYLCILEDLRAAFHDNAVFSVKIIGGDIPATEKLFRHMLSIGQKGPYLEITLKRRNWHATYQVVVGDGCVEIYNDVANYAYHVGTERFTADDPALSDISTRIEYTIVRDAMSHLASIDSHVAIKREQNNLDDFLTKGSFIFRKDELRRPIDAIGISMRLQLKIEKVMSPIAFDNGFDPVILCSRIDGTLFMDGQANNNNGVFALRSGSKMIQTGVVYFGLLRDLQIEDPGIYEIIVHVFASRPTKRVDKPLDGSYPKYSW